MSTHLKSTINAIYDTDTDTDFLVLGLTGRTGSGCSTVAKILQSDIHKIRHSLYSGNTPETNEQRKERILYRHFQKNWRSFQQIQVRSLITLALVEKGVEDVINSIKSEFDAEPFNEAGVRSTLLELASKFAQSEEQDIPPEAIIKFYTSELPAKCEVFRQHLGSSIFTKFYQRIGKNIRMSGDPLDATLKDGCFFTLAEKINAVIKKLKTANKKLKQSTLLVIDAIRNPLEALFFKTDTLLFI